MLEVALLLARYVFLFLLYLFLWGTYRGMVRELRARGRGGEGEKGRGGEGEREVVGVRSTGGGRDLITSPPHHDTHSPLTTHHSPGVGPRLRLVVIESGEGGLAPGTFYFVEGSLTFGRAPDNAIVLTDRFASGHHARLTQRPDGELWLEDLGSTNGTRLNGRDVQGAVPVQAGDEVGIGAVRFRVEHELRL
jgi:hypothetical protein